MTRRISFRMLIAPLVALGLLSTSSVYAATSVVRPPLSAQAAILVDGRTGQILFGRNIHGEFYPASITKIMTAYLAITHAWNRTVVVSTAAQDQIGSSAYLVAGEKLPMPKVVRAMMLVSGNDAAYAVAQTVAGSVPAFVRMMNAQARAWGAPGIHFDNPDGLPNPKHVVSALGMAIITEHAMKNPIFAQIVDTKKSTLPPDPKPRVYYNQNLLLYQYPGAVGVKIGYTIEADETIVGAAKRHGLFLIEVLLHDTPAGLWPDAENLLTWGFQHYQTESLVSVGEPLGHLQIGGRAVPVKSVQALSYDVLKTSPPQPRIVLRATHPKDGQAIRSGQRVGEASVWAGSTLVGQVPLRATKAVAPRPPVVHHRWQWLLFPALAALSVIRLAALRTRRPRGRMAHG